MKFVYPAFLFALFALAIPIIIHLFNFKKFKKVAFSNVTFLREIKQESKSKSRLKELLILLSRLLAFTFLVLAFAQPYLPVTQKQVLGGEKAVSIYIDNSFSMSANGEEGRQLDVAKQYAYKILDAYPAGQRFQLLTNDLSATSQRSYTKENIETQLAELSTTPISMALPKLLRQQTDWFREQEVSFKESFIISDFQESTSGDFASEIDTSVNYRLLKLNTTSASNLFVDSVWLDAPSIRKNEAITVGYRISNSGTEDLKGVSVSLIINEQNFGNTKVDVNQNTQTEGSFTYTPTESGFYKATIKVSDFPIENDNEWNFSYEIASKSKVLIINEQDSSKALGKLYSSKNEFLTTQVSVSSLNYAQLKNNDLVVLNNVSSLSKGLVSELKTFIENGGNVCVIPSLIQNSDNQLLFETLGVGTIGPLDTNNRSSNQINYKDPFYQGVFNKEDERINLPMVFNFIKWKNRELNTATTLLSLASGGPLFVKSNMGKGNVFVWASNLSNDNSNLADHSIFVLSMYKIGLSNALNKAITYTIKPNLYFESTSSLEVESTKMKTKNSEFIPELRSSNNTTKLWPHENGKNAGFYELYQKDSLVDVFALNYNRSESEMSYLSDEKLNELTDGFDNIAALENDFSAFEYNLEQLTSGIKYWKWMILLALLMLVFEVLLIKLWKN